MQRYIGIDLGGTNIKGALVSETGKILKQRSVPTHAEAGAEAVTKTIAAMICALAEGESVSGVGMGCPGTVDDREGTVVYACNLGWVHYDVRTALRELTGYSVRLVNDANAAGFAETWINKKIKTAFYLMLSNNIGGAVIIDGAPYSGYHHHSGEVGHICIERNGRQCYCGQRGCVDRYLAATELSDLTDGRLIDFFALLEQKDPRAVRCWDTYLDDLALTNHNVHMLFDCPIILGGYVGEFIAPYMDEIRRRTAALDPFEPNADYLHACHYRTEAIAAGSALHFIVKFLETV